MTTKAEIDQFMELKVVAVAGVSRNPQKFGCAVYRDLKAKGQTVYPINPNTETVDGDRCYPNLAALPSVPQGLIIVTSPAQTENLVREAAQAGVCHVWMQQGSESAAAVLFCRQNGISVITGECIFMYREPSAWFHRAHRWVNKVVGKEPK